MMPIIYQLIVYNLIMLFKIFINCIYKKDVQEKHFQMGAS